MSLSKRKIGLRCIRVKYQHVRFQNNALLFLSSQTVSQHFKEFLSIKSIYKIFKRRALTGPNITIIVSIIQGLSRAIERRCHDLSTMSVNYSEFLIFNA